MQFCYEIDNFLSSDQAVDLHVFNGWPLSSLENTSKKHMLSNQRLPPPPSSKRQHSEIDDCLEKKREDC